MKAKIFSVLCLLGLWAQAAQAKPARYIEVEKLRPPVYLNRGDSVNTVRTGQHLREGDSVFIPLTSDSRFALDYNQGYFLVVPATQFKVLSLRYQGCGAYTVLGVYTGRIYSGVRKKTCPDTFYYVLNLTQSASIELNAGYFSIAFKKDRVVLGVESGTAIAQSGGVKSTGRSGWGMLMLPGKPPIIQRIDYLIATNQIKVQDIGLNQVRVSGNSNALNDVFVNGEKVEAIEDSGDRANWHIDVKRDGTGTIKIETVNAQGISSFKNIRNNNS